MDEIRKPKPFSHVIDVLRGRAAVDEDELQTKHAAAADDDDDKEKKDAKKAQGDDEDDDKDKKKTKKAQSDEDDDKDKKNSKRASDKDDEGSDNDERKGKAAWRSKDDPRCEEDSVAARMALWPEAGSDAADRADDRDQGLAAARAREQGRIRAILNSGPGLTNFQAALSLALNSSLSRRAAVAVIAAMPEEQPQPQRRSAEAPSLRERMAEVKMPAIQADAGSPSHGITAPQGTDAWVAQTAAAIVAAGKRRRGEA